jgi:hypothetical protein
VEHTVYILKYILLQYIMPSQRTVESLSSASSVPR